jgi:hypothetical protein
MYVKRKQSRYRLRGMRGADVARIKERTTKTHSFDNWLSRLSQFAQILLAIVTLGTIWYTVIPLYQKAVLEEAIARKEFELKEANQKLEENYLQIRHQTVSRIIVGTLGCMSSNRFIKDVPSSDTDGYRGAVEGWQKRLLSANASQCIEESFRNTKQLSDLRAQDFDLVAEKIKQISAACESRRIEVLKVFEEVESTQSSNAAQLDVLSESDEKIAALFDNTVKLQSDLANFLGNEKNKAQELQLKEFRIKTRIAKTQSRLTREYLDFAQKQILSLREIKWIRPAN